MRLTPIELAKTIRRQVSLRVKEIVFRHYLMPFNRHLVEPILVQHFKSSGPVTFLDVGASSGEFAASLRAAYGIGRALLVEPQPERCIQLRQRFPEAEVSVEQCALAEAEGVREMDVLNWDYSSSLLPIRRDEPNLLGGGFDFRVRERIQCRVRTLDELLVEKGWLESIDLLKIDVQGAEMMVLRGASASLSKIKMVLCEVSFRPVYEGSAIFSEVYDFLRGKGFRLADLQQGFKGRDTELLQADALFLNNSGPLPPQ